MNVQLVGGNSTSHDWLPSRPIDHITKKRKIVNLKVIKWRCFSKYVEDVESHSVTYGLFLRISASTYKHVYLYEDMKSSKGLTDELHEP